MDIIHEIIKKIGPRPVSSANERKAGQIIKSQFNKYCDIALEEKFYCNPGSENVWMFVLLVLYLIALLSYFSSPIISIISLALYFINYFAAKLLDINIYSPFFKKRCSYNIIGIKNPKKSKKKTVIFTAHHDSGKILPLVEKTGFWLIKLNILTTAVSYFIIFLSLFAKSKYLFAFLCLNFVLLLIIILSFCSTQYSFGANDNLSGEAVLIGIAKKIKSPNHVKIIFVSFGAEEIGCIGSKEYVKRHFNEIKNAIVVNFESVGIGKFGFMEKERHYLKYNKKIINDFKAILKKNNAVLFNKKIGFMGVSDAGSFLKKGIKAITVSAVDDSAKIPNWHSKADLKVDKSNIETLSKSAIDYIAYLDASLDT